MTDPTEGRKPIERLSELEDIYTHWFQANEGASPVMTSGTGEVRQLTDGRIVMVQNYTTYGAYEEPIG
jgi:hypothetical protein